MKSKMYLDHKALVSRIKDVLINEGHSEHHPMLIELFPEIYEEVRRDHWNSIHKIGHVYARVGDNGYVISLLMPVVIPSRHTQEPHQDTIAILNLIAGNFWSDTVTVSHSVSDINDEQWKHLFKGMNDDRLFHVGKFNHGLKDITLHTEHDAIKLFKYHH